MNNALIFPICWLVPSASLEQLGQDLASRADEGAIDIGRHGRAFQIDFHHFRATGFGQRSQAGSRINDCGCTDDNEDVAIRSSAFRGGPGFERQHFAEPYNTGTGKRTATAAWNGFEILGIVYPLPGATGAAESPDAAMNFKDILGPGALMEAVDVLRN